MTKALLPQLLSRHYRSAIIITSSVISQCPAPGLSAYSSSKAAVSQFAEALHYEIKDKIDVMAWDCGSVATKLNTFKVGFRTTTNTAVAGAL